jgi:hypothetical protein
MAYIIKEKQGKFHLIQTDEAAESLKLGIYPTREKAEYWKARHKLRDKVEDFVEEQIDNFAGILDELEIIKLISQITNS